MTQKLWQFGGFAHITVYIFKHFVIKKSCKNLRIIVSDLFQNDHFFRSFYNFSKKGFLYHCIQILSFSSVMGLVKNLSDIAF